MAAAPPTPPPSRAGRAEVQGLARATLARLAAAGKALSEQYGRELHPIH